MTYVTPKNPGPHLYSWHSGSLLSLLASPFVPNELNDQQLVECIPRNSRIYSEDSGGEVYRSDHNGQYDSINGVITVQTPSPINFSTPNISVLSEGDTTTFRDDHPGDSAVFDVTPSVFEVDTPNTTFGTSLDAESSSNDSVASDRLSDIGEDDSVVVDPDNAHDILREIRVKNVGRIVIGTLNINSIASKFEKLKVIISNSLDILVIQETKLDSSFPDSQFLMDGYRKPYRLDRNRHGGGVMVYIREDIPSRELQK